MSSEWCVLLLLLSVDGDGGWVSQNALACSSHTWGEMLTTSFFLHHHVTPFFLNANGAGWISSVFTSTLMMLDLYPTSQLRIRSIDLHWNKSSLCIAPQKPSVPMRRSSGTKSSFGSFVGEPKFCSASFGLHQVLLCRVLWEASALGRLLLTIKSCGALFARMQVFSCV